MFEDRTFTNLNGEYLSKAPEGIDIREGSIYYDAGAGFCFKAAELYLDMSGVLDLVFLTTATGEYLDMKGQEFGLSRNNATPARYEFHYEGARPLPGERFFADLKYFALIDRDGVLYLEAETPGGAANGIISGTKAIPVNNIKGLAAASFGALVDPGADIESDDNYRQRIREKISGPAENGNRQHYKTWCESVPGVGRAHVIPLWDGDNTVKAVLVGVDGKPASALVVDEVQEYVDPGGTGLGNGKANIGGFFTAVSADSLEVDISFAAQPRGGFSLEDVRAQATEAITAHLKDIALNTVEGEQAVVRVSAIGNIIFSLPAVLDYGGLELNGEELNIGVPDTAVAVMGALTVTELT